jgi:hypothetical protein
VITFSWLPAWIIFYSFPTGGMSMGGAEATAPPIFFTGDKFKNMPVNQGPKPGVYLV